MKKSCSLPRLARGMAITNKTLLVMKLTAVLLLAACLQVGAKGNAQNISISQKNTSLEKVFKEIHRKTGYQFFYQDELLKQAKKFDIDVKDASIEQVLEVCFKDQPLNFTITEKAIIVKGKEEAKPANAPPLIANIDRQITGKVTDEKGIPLVGVNVTVVGQKVSVSTDANGNFSIAVADNAVLNFSYVGFKTMKVPVKNKTSLVVTLSLEVSNLNELIVVGYGKMKKSDLSSAVVNISSSDLQRTVNVTLDQALQGKSPNVYVSQTSGAPGAGASVIIRGISTVSGNYQPLYVVDGVQIRPGVPSGGAYNSNASLANELAGINPDDIENISVLEGPAATSIYGSAGANGVLMITTKQGKAGLTKLNASETQTFQQRPNTLPVMNLTQYALYIQKLQKLGLVGVQPPELADPTLLGPGTNWQNELFRPTRMQKHSLSLSGGNDKSTFYFSSDYLNQDGVAIGSGFQRGSIRLNLTNQATKWLKFGTNLSSFATKENVNTFQGNIINLALGQNPTIPVKNPDGTFGGPSLAQAQYATTNPVAVATLNNNYNTSFGIIGGLNFDITPIKNLVWHTEINGNYTFNNNFTFNPSYTIGAYVNPNTTGSRGSSNNYWASLNTRVQYDYKIKEHAITVMAGHEAQYFAYQGLSGNGQGYSTNSIQELSVAAPLTQTTSSYRGNGANESYFARLNYVYNDKYIVQFVGRRDGSSNFGPNNKFGTFPAVSVAWKISEEKFMKSLSFVNDLKLRAEYGISGNAASGGAIYSRLYPTATVFGSNGFLPANFPNPDLKWEQDKSFNVGLDLHMFHNRVEVIADAYRKDISNLILAASGPSYMGGFLNGGYGGQMSWPIKNYGGMRNEGIGISVNTINIVKKDFQWKTGVNFSIDRNKVTKLVSTIYTQYYSSTNSRQAQFLTQVGQPLSMFTGYIAEGLFQNYKDIAGHAVQTGAKGTSLVIDPVKGSWVGDVKFKDINNDGVVNNEDRTIIGNPWPKFTYNFNTTFDYKGFELSLFFTGVQGNQLLNLTRYQNEFLPLGTTPYSNHFQGAANFAMPSSLNPADALNVTLTNPGFNIQRPSKDDANGSVRLSQWNVEDGSYLKLKNVRLSYRVPSKFLSRTNFFKGALFTIQSQNVFTITKYTGYDPEIGMYNYSGVNIVGMDEGRYPSTRSFSVSLALDF
ncbi:MAG: TonB-dependent receptor [Ferruginibacter sp.]|nr:TonB-dependent receptor [Ferruginibacter sp.]